MRFNEIIKEANPPGISRRGFLKGLGAAAATAAAPGLATPAAAAAAVPAAAAQTVLGPLFTTAMSYGLEQGWLGHVYPGNVDPDDYEPDPKLMVPQGKKGEMPWGEHYSLKKTPSGQEYLVTAAPHGDTAVFTYVKDGEVRNIEVAWDHEGRGYGEVLSSQDEEDMNAMYDFIDAHGEDPKLEGAMIDAIIKGTVQQQPEPEPEKQAPGPAELARLAGIVKTASQQSTKQSAQQPQQPAQAPAQSTTTALPAPDDAEVLEPELQKQKQTQPAKNNKEP